MKKYVLTAALLAVLALPAFGATRVVASEHFGSTT
jgi:hypothetical protein